MSRPNALLDQPLDRAVFQLAWPAVASMFLRMGFTLVDTFWVGRLGADPLAAITAASFLVWVLSSGVEVVAAGLRAYVSQRVGAGEAEGAARAAWQGMSVGGLFTVGFAALLFAGSGLAFSVMGTTAPVSAGGIDYIRTICLGVPLMTGFVVQDTAFRASGDTRTPMLIMGAALLVNAVIDPMLIFGFGPVPALGLTGAALATVLSQGGAMAVGLWHLRRVGLFGRAGGATFDFRLGFGLLRVGVPVGSAGVLFSLVYVGIARFATPYGSAALAGLGVGHRIESVSYFVAVGLSDAAATLVGQNLGAQRSDDARRAAWRVTAIGGVWSLVVTAVLLAIPEMLIRVFTPDAEVIAQGASYLRIVGVSQLGMSTVVILDGAFGGAGDTLPPTVMNALSSLLRLPLCWVLAGPLALGAAGIWWAISASTIVNGLVTAAWFARGRWVGRGLPT